MTPEDFARTFTDLYREVYRRAVRRVADGRERLAPETTALLLHLSQTGPLTLSELAPHLARSVSTLSAKVSELEAQGLLLRHKDEHDARRTLIWLSAAGRARLLEALDVLDTGVLSEAAGRMDPNTPSQLLDSLRALLAALPSHPRSDP